MNYAPRAKLITVAAAGTAVQAAASGNFSRSRVIIRAHPDNAAALIYYGNSADLSSGALVEATRAVLQAGQADTIEVFGDRVGYFDLSQLYIDADTNDAKAILTYMEKV